MPVNQMVISKLVTQLGHEISSVSSGLEAIEAAEQGDFHVVLMDLEMPQLDGASATEALRDHGYLRPIIALTAHTMRAELDRCLDAGMDACLTKPVRLEDLQLALNRYGHQ